jgi:isoleucyl-tRNA synthetase
MKKSFKKLDKLKSSEIEQLVLKYWQSSNIFQKSIDQRPKEKSYVFYDGPPFITGIPHFGTLLPSIVKDAVPRFWTRVTESRGTGVGIVMVCRQRTWLKRNWA